MNDRENIQRMIDAVERRDISIDNQAPLAEAVLEACRVWFKTLRSMAMKGELGAPDWLSFELKIWELGESLRLFLKQKKAWRGKGALMDAAADILSCKDYGKGRQTFALLLGDFGGASYGPNLGDALLDRDVRGHAVKSLTKLRIPGFEVRVENLVSSESGWIRAAGRKYLAAMKGAGSM